MPISPNQPNTSDVPQGPTEWDNLATSTETANPSSTPNEYGLLPEDEARLAEVGLSAADLSPFPPSSRPQGNEKEKPVTAENNTSAPNTSTPNEYGLSPEDEARLAEVGLSSADLSPFPPSSRPQGNEKEKPVTAENAVQAPNTSAPNESAPNGDNLSDGGLSDPGFGDF